jgi:hypothetical protein
MEFELIKIEGKPDTERIGQPWFTVSECCGRNGLIRRDCGFATDNLQAWCALSKGWSEIGKQLLATGITHGQRAIIRVTRSYPKGEKVYFRFRAE